MPNNCNKLFITFTHPQIMSKFIKNHAHKSTKQLTHANYTINTKIPLKHSKNSIAKQFTKRVNYSNVDTYV